MRKKKKKKNDAQKLNLKKSLKKFTLPMVNYHI